MPKSLEPESHFVGHFPHLESRLVGHLHSVIFSHYVPGLRSRRSQLRACPNKWGLSLNLWGNTVQVICWCFSPGASHSTAKRYWDSLTSGMGKKKKKCIFVIQDCKPLGTGWDFSQDYIGIGYCGLEGDYSCIYDPEILNHLPGSILFLY